MTAPTPLTSPLLQVRDLRTWFHTPGGVAKAVDGVSFDLHAGETVGLVGESGSGKSVTGLSLMRLVDPPGRIEAGSRIVFEGRDLSNLDEPAMRALRGHRIAMVFQEPMTALNPVFTIGNQIAEVVLVHEGGNKRAAMDRAIEMLSLVGIPDSRDRARRYPHELSGGMRQRVLIAMALILRPSLLIADEPTTALDVTIQAQILDLLERMQKEFGTAVLLVTHDLGVVARSCSRVLVMYGGEIVEHGNVPDVFANPLHPYTQGLLKAMPRLGQKVARLETIPGTVPPATAWPDGCRFRNRCPQAFGACHRRPPEPDDHGHAARCHLLTTGAAR